MILKIIFTKAKFFSLICILIFFSKINEKIFKSKSFNIRKNDIKVCICTLGKKENKYIREYVNHYEKYGVDKIYLYDNNDINGENFEDAISDYIKKGISQYI